MTFALAYWKYIAMGVLVALLGIQTARISSLKSDVRACEQRNLAQVSDWRAKYAEAVSEATAAKAATEAAQSKISTEIGNDTQKRLDALRASLAGSLRAAKANPGSPGLAYLPVTTSTAVSADGEAAPAELVDRERCGRAYIVATGFQAWVLQQHAIDRVAE